MKLLLDTHIAVWLVDRPDLLKARELEALETGDPVLVSVVSLWEIRLKWEKRHPSGDRKGPLDPRDVLDGLQDLGVALVSLEAEHVVGALKTPLDHGDPFDRQLLLHAQELDAKLLTRDRQLIGHPLALAIS